jgi:hypothetical protein
MMVFFCALFGMFLWEFLPQYVFPMLSSMAFLCWVAPNNPVMNFVGSGLGGMGFLNLSFDWANVGTPPMSQVAGNLFLTPFGTQLIVFLAISTKVRPLSTYNAFPNISQQMVPIIPI